MENFEDLFEQISELRKCHKDKEDFNVFHSIGFSTQETMHSHLISTLLNPKGSHKQENQFLKLFLDHSEITDFNTENVTINRERRADKRYIDITIENNKAIIIIENKIWARDQDRQLEAYYKYCEKFGKERIVAYLTPYGHLPSNYSLGETLTIDKVKCISYEKVIIPWIEKCSENAEGRLKASLEMYNELLHKLINRDKYMNEIFAILKEDREKLKLSYELSLALQGRNYLKEFPEIIEDLKDRLNIAMYNRNEQETDDEINAYTYTHKIPIISIEHPDPNLNNWQINFEEWEVYAEKEEKKIHLFNPTDLNNKRLQTLIFNDGEAADVWINIILDEMQGLKICC